MIEVQGLSKSFGKPPVTVLDDISFTVKNGDFVTLTGRSGSGKTTLLYCISTLDKADRGKVLVDGQDLYELTSAEIDRFRNQKMGFVFQFHYLLPELSALENVLMPARKRGNYREQTPYAKHLLALFDLEKHQDKLPGQLSGGQAQRVAIARAIVSQPPYLFADEPTGSLDSNNAKIIMEIFTQLNKEFGTTIICVTHDQRLSGTATHQLNLFDGRLTS